MAEFRVGSVARQCCYNEWNFGVVEGTYKTRDKINMLPTSYTRCNKMARLYVCTPSCLRRLLLELLNQRLELAEPCVGERGGSVFLGVGRLRHLWRRRDPSEAL